MDVRRGWIIAFLVVLAVTAVWAFGSGTGSGTGQGVISLRDGVKSGDTGHTSPREQQRQLSPPARGPKNPTTTNRRAGDSKRVQQHEQHHGVFEKAPAFFHRDPKLKPFKNKAQRVREQHTGREVTPIAAHVATPTVENAAAVMMGNSNQTERTMASGGAGHHPPVCTYKERFPEGGDSASLTANAGHNNWEFYTKHPTCAFSRHVSCGGGTESRTTRRKGKALVMMMLKAFDESESTTEWSNIDFFLSMGYIPEGVQTELFEGVDFIFYRIKNDVEKVELCSKQGNVYFYFVPPCRCDLCAHGRILHHIGYNPDGTSTAEYLKSEGEGGFPYKQVVMLNSGVRGPIQHPDSGYWIDNAAMAGEDSRPQWLQDDLLQHWTTVAGTKMNTGPAFRQTAFPLHLQSYYVVVPISSLPVYYRIFLKGGCDGKAPYDDVPAKFGCIVHGEILTSSEFIDPTKNRLVKPRLPLKHNNNDSTQSGVEEAPHNYRVYSFGRRAMFELKDSKDAAAENRWWAAHGGHLGEYVDPCLGMFVKFGGEIFKLQGAPFHKAVSYVTKRLRLLGPSRINTAAKGVGDVPSTVVDTLLSGAKTSGQTSSCGLFDPDVRGWT